MQNRHKRFEPMHYEYAELMDELNDLFIDIKLILIAKQVNRKEITSSRMDKIQSQINQALKRFAHPMRHY